MATLPPTEDVADFWEDIEASKKLNGIFANRIYVQPLGDGMVRINLGEILEEYDVRYHTAVVVTAQQAKQFAQVIFNVSTAILLAENPPAPFSPPTNNTITPPQDDDSGKG